MGLDNYPREVYLTAFLLFILLFFIYLLRFGVVFFFRILVHKTCNHWIKFDPTTFDGN